MALGPNEQVIREAVFDKPALLKYHWVTVFVMSAFCILLPVTIPMSIVYVFILDKMIDSWSCTLTNRALHVKKGVFVKSESTIPLDKITDLLTVQGPLMRRYDLFKVSVETAGQSTLEGAHLVSLLGITDTRDFRLAVLEQRDLIMSGERPAVATPPAPEVLSNVGATESLLAEIRDGIMRTEEHLRKIANKS